MTAFNPRQLSYDHHSMRIIRGNDPCSRIT